MHVYYKFGLLLIFMLSVSTSYAHASPPEVNQSLSYDDNYSDDYADYYDDLASEGGDNSTAFLKNETEISIPVLLSTSTTTLAPQPKKSTLATPRSNHVLEPICPSACLCLEDYKHIVCNDAGINRIPHNIPSSALLINLSNNRIMELRDEDFANITKVREINLSGNHLKAINKKAFEGLIHLNRLRLANNKLTYIEPDAFSGASDLSELDLSNNSIVLPDGPFLIQPGLLKLYCRNCSLKRVYDDTFRNLTSLVSLKLDHNDFQKKINTKAFAPLPNLIKLQLPELDQESVTELCNQLKAIDNISFKHFDISCFELVLGASFNESLIPVTDPPFKAPSSVEVVPSPPEAIPNLTETNDGTKTGKTKPSGKGNKMAGGNDFQNVNLTLPTSATSDNESNIGAKNVSIYTASILGSNGSDNTTNITKTSAPLDDSEKTYQVPVSRETINLILICIMIIAAVGIIIGIIFRKDVGGIKTKCCRTRKPEPKDQVHPTEEIPLNKLA